MSGKNFRWLLPCAALLIAALTWWFGRPFLPGPASGDGRPGGGSSASRNAASPDGATRPPEDQRSAPRTAAQIDDILSRITAASDPRASRALLAELRQILDALPRNIASLEVRSFLASRKDAATKLDVTLKAGGALDDSSSVRVFMLDYLGQIDRAAAAAVGRQILSAPTSPDEWAVSLRNVAWADSSPDTLAYLRTKAGEMISNPAWRQKPSAGFLEAFDVIVHARGFDLAPQLTELVRDKENRAVAHAAYLTLDRLTIADPATTLAALAARPELMEGREQTRANFFARGDVRDPQQKALLESYLLDPRRSAQELQAFAGLFPSANYMISNNLLTETSTPAREELATRDIVALQVIEEWLADPRFTALQPQFATIRDRLRTFVQQAATPPLVR